MKLLTGTVSNLSAQPTVHALAAVSPWAGTISASSEVMYTFMLGQHTITFEGEANLNEGDELTVVAVYHGTGNYRAYGIRNDSQMGEYFLSDWSVPWYKTAFGAGIASAILMFFLPPIAWLFFLVDMAYVVISLCIDFSRKKAQKMLTA